MKNPWIKKAKKYKPCQCKICVARRRKFYVPLVDSLFTKIIIPKVKMFCKVKDESLDQKTQEK